MRDKTLQANIAPDKSFTHEEIDAYVASEREKHGTLYEEIKRAHEAGMAEGAAKERERCVKWAREGDVNITFSEMLTAIKSGKEARDETVPGT